MQICYIFSVSHYMRNVHNVDKMKIGLVALMYKFVMCLYVNIGTLWDSGGRRLGLYCKDIAP